MENEPTLICYRFQCARYLTCGRSGGTGCCLERPPHRAEIPDGACTKSEAKAVLGRQ